MFGLEEIMARLRLEKGDELYALETPDGNRLSVFDPTLAEQVMRKRRTCCTNWHNEGQAMIVWISRALAIHDRQLAEHGGGSGVRDEGLLDSALARPQQRHAYGDPLPDLADLATSLAYGLARDHPLVQGNKRTAAVVCEVVIELNDGRLLADELELYPQSIGLAEGSIAEAGFAQWLRRRIVSDRPGEVQEAAGRYRAVISQKPEPRKRFAGKPNTMPWPPCSRSAVDR